MRPIEFLALSLLLSVAWQTVAEPVRVRAVPLGELLVQSEYSAPASVESLADSRISAELTGVIERIAVRIGDRVAAGEVLVELECSDYRFSLRELQGRRDGLAARIRFAARQLERARTLNRQQTVARELLDQREAELLSLEAEQASTEALIERAERDRERCRIIAPFSSVVTTRLVGVGEYVTPGTPLLTLLDIEQIELGARILAADADRLSDSARPVFRNSGREYPLRLRVLLPSIDPNTRTREARLEFTDEAALPGAGGRLVWRGPPLLPAEMVIRREDRLGVMLAKDEQARFHPLPEAEEGRPTPVDLPADTLIITDGRAGLEDGQIVRVQGE